MDDIPTKLSTSFSPIYELHHKQYISLKTIASLEKIYLYKHWCRGERSMGPSVITSTSSYVASVYTVIFGIMRAPYLSAHSRCILFKPLPLPTQLHMRNVSKGMWPWARLHSLEAPPPHHFILQLLYQTCLVKFELSVCVHLWEIINVSCIITSISTLQCYTLCYSRMSHATNSLISWITPSYHVHFDCDMHNIMEFRV